MSDQDELIQGPALAEGPAPVRHVTRHWLDAWERREMPVFTALPYGMLGFCAILIIVLRTAPGTRWLAGLGLCGLALAWLLVGAAAGTTIGTAFRPAHGPSWRGRPWMRVVFVAGLATIMIIMVIGSPLFGFFTFTGYLYAAQLPSGWWRAAGVVAISVPTGASQAGGFPTAAAGSAGAAIFSGAIAVNVVVAGAFMWFGWVGTMQSERRVRLVEELSEANQRLEATLAENATLHEQLVSQAREAGVLDERQRMAREIHDTIAQGLTGIITQLQAAEEAADDPMEWRRHFAAATRLARESLSEARRSVDALRPEPLEGTRLAEAVVSVADRWSALHGVPAQVAVTGAVRPLPAETEVVLLRAAQEALANVAKHAAASRVWLTLSYMDCEVALDVRDDGRGFDPAGTGGGVGGGTVGGGTVDGGSAGDGGVGGGTAGGGTAGGGTAGGRAVDGGAVDGGAVGGGTVGGGTVGGGEGGDSRASGGDRLARGGFGLLAMRQRVEGVCGTLQVESEPGGGTVVSACVPDIPRRQATTRGGAGPEPGPGDRSMAGYADNGAAGNDAARRPARERKVEA